MSLFIIVPNFKGGYSWNNRCMVDIVQCYDPTEDVWSKTFCLPAALGGVRACTLTVLPRLFNRQEYKPTTVTSIGRNQQHAGQGDMQPAVRMEVDG